MQFNHVINTLFIVIICKISIRGTTSIIIRSNKNNKENKAKQTKQKQEIQQIKPLKNTVNNKKKTTIRSPIKHLTQDENLQY